jgi:hypothetical protein
LIEAAKNPESLSPKSRSTDIVPADRLFRSLFRPSVSNSNIFAKIYKKYLQTAKRYDIIKSESPNAKNVIKEGRYAKI